MRKRKPRIHLLSEVNEETRTAICAHCGPVPISKGGASWRCVIAHRAKGKMGERARANARIYNRTYKTLHERPHRQFKQSQCETCGFAGHPCQLDVHHLDGNHRNNEPSNLQTLCANCHRLITWNECIARTERSEQTTSTAVCQG